MVVDTSALVAILFGEPAAERFAHALGEATARLLSAVTRVELSFVVEGRKGETGQADFELLPRNGAVDVIAVTPQQAEIAIEAFRRFGRASIKRASTLAIASPMRLPRRSATPCCSTAMASPTPTFALCCHRSRWRPKGSWLILGSRAYGFGAGGVLPISCR